MLPIPQILSQRFIANETESLRAVTSILPVEGAQAEAPLWERLRPGTPFIGQLLQKTGNVAGAADQAWYKVQIQLPQQPPAIVQMQLPAHLATQQTLNMQFMGLAQSSKGEAGATPQVKWGATATGLTASRTTGGGDILTAADEATGPAAGLMQASGLQASLVELSSPAKSLQRWLTSTPLQQQPSGLQAHGVVSFSPQKPQVLAQDLKQALDHSGLFYESHLKEATLGARPWHQLLQEPQNKPQFAPPEMVAQQLQVLEQQKVEWRGEVWPGQSMQWQVSERKNSPQSSQDPSLNSLQSNMTLHLPKLGEISVRITMIEGRFSIRLRPDSADSLSTLQAERSQLALNLQSAGLALDGLQIVRDAVNGEGGAHAS